MENSILDTIKKMLGLSLEDTDFDVDVIAGINAVFPALSQLGVGSDDGFMITDSSTTWKDYLENDKMLNNVVMYIFIKVKLVFDPPANGTIAKSHEEMAKELEWRIQLRADKGVSTNGTD